MENTILLFSDYNIKIDEYWNEYLDYCECDGIDCSNHTIDSNEFYDWLCDTLSFEFSDLKDEIKYSNNNTECVVTGSVGRWNGNFNIEPRKFDTLIDAIDTCIINCDNITISECNGTIIINGYHHDGSHCFYINKLNEKGINCDDESLLNNKMYHEAYSLY